MNTLIKEVNEGDFDQLVLQSNRPVLVDFWAEWCGPCRQLAPTVKAVAERYKNAAQVAKLNVDDSPSIAQRYGIRGIPTLILFQDGEENERIVGVVREAEISRRIGRHLSAEGGQPYVIGN